MLCYFSILEISENLHKICCLLYIVPDVKSVKSQNICFLLNVYEKPKYSTHSTLQYTQYTTINRHSNVLYWLLQIFSGIGCSVSYTSWPQFSPAWCTTIPYIGLQNGDTWHGLYHIEIRRKCFREKYRQYLDFRENFIKAVWKRCIYFFSCNIFTKLNSNNAETKQFRQNSSRGPVLPLLHLILRFLLKIATHGVAMLQHRGSLGRGNGCNMRSFSAVCGVWLQHVESGCFMWSLDATCRVWLQHVESGCL